MSKPQLLGVRFTRSEAGATASIFALLCVPIMAAAGMALDGARWYNARHMTGSAVDSAVLVGARRMQLKPDDEAGALAAALDNYKANTANRMPLSRDEIGFEIADNGTAVRATGSATLQTTLLGVIGISELIVSHPAKASFLSGLNAGTNIEVSLVLDFTGSMCDSGDTCANGTKLQGLRDGAKELIDIVVNSNQSAYLSRVALVPFTTRVRVASDSSDGTLMGKLTNLPPTWSGYVEDCSQWSYSGSGGGGGESADGGTWTCTGTKTTVLKSNWKIMPCVTERIFNDDWSADADLDFTDNAPSSNRWIMGHGGNRAPFYWNSTDSSANPTPYGTPTAPTGTWNYSETPHCAEAPEANEIVPLSSDKAMLKAKVDGFTAEGATAGPLGTSFGWYMLSPNWTSIWPSASAPGSYDDVAAKTANGSPKLRKVAVIMTDGVYNTMRGAKNLDKPKSAKHAERLCTEMKAKGIEIYTIGFALDQLGGADRSTAETMLKACGSTIKHFYSTLNVVQLQTAFRDIALKVTPIRLTD